MGLDVTNIPKGINDTPAKDVSNLSAYQTNTVSKDLRRRECKQNINHRLELSHELHLAISILKVVKCLCSLLKDVEYCVGRTTASELGGDRIRDNVLPDLLGVFLQGSIKEGPELQRCVWVEFEDIILVERQGGHFERPAQNVEYIKLAAAVRLWCLGRCICAHVLTLP